MTTTTEPSLIGKLHDGIVYGRRIRVLRDSLARVLPQGARVLDIGCGDGLLDHLLLQARPDLKIEGLDVFVRPKTWVPVTVFDGFKIPHADQSFDAVMFVDVLHHTDDARVLLREAARVAADCVVLKDHTRNGLMAGTTLRFMDWVGNAHHGVVLPYNYLSRKEWDKAFAEVGLKPETWESRIPLYPWPASWVFGRSLHFIARLKRNGTGKA